MSATQGFEELIQAIKAGRDHDDIQVGIFISKFLLAEGASRVAKQQAERLAENDIAVTVYTFEADIIPEHYTVKTIKPWLSSKVSHPSSAFRGLFNFNIPQNLLIAGRLKYLDWLIVHQEPLVVLAYLCKKLHGTKVVYWHHHISNRLYEETAPERLYGRWVTPLNWTMIQRFDRVISVSNFSRLELLKTYGVESEVIYNTASVTGQPMNQSIDSSYIRQKYSIGASPLILFVGRVVPYKNIHTLIAAFHQVRTVIPDAKLMIVGRYENDEYFRRLKGNCDNAVIFTGYIPDSELLHLYRECNVYATCSLLEGFNLPIVEAQRWGKPVVAFDIGPHKEVVNNGFLVKEGDTAEFSHKIVHLLSQEDDLDGGNCRRRTV